MFKTAVNLDTISLNLIFPALLHFTQFPNLGSPNENIIVKLKVPL